MAWGLSGKSIPKVWVVACKGCHKNVPAGVDALPKGNIRVDCPLCDEKRMYRPSEVDLGRVHVGVEHKILAMRAHYRELRRMRA